MLGVHSLMPKFTVAGVEVGDMGSVDVHFMHIFFAESLIKKPKNPKWIRSPSRVFQLILYGAGFRNIDYLLVFFIFTPTSNDQVWSTSKSV